MTSFVSRLLNLVSRPSSPKKHNTAPEASETEEPLMAKPHTSRPAPSSKAKSSLKVKVPRKPRIRANKKRPASEHRRSHSSSGSSSITIDLRKRRSLKDMAFEKKKWFLIRQQTVNMPWPRTIDWGGYRGRYRRWLNRRTDLPSSPCGTVYPDHVARERGEGEDDELFDRVMPPRTVEEQMGQWAFERMRTAEGALDEESEEMEGVARRPPSPSMAGELYLRGGTWKQRNEGKNKAAINGREVPR